MYRYFLESSKVI